ncbi:MAG: DUF4919 domain-containing protein [Chitinophagaceae bacterium]|nr:DUF4919 domain-containing protein [Chitinophagaceae bacterium]
MHWHIRFIAIFFPALMAMQGYAQGTFEMVDRQKVEQLVNDASMATFYPTLLERFNAFDTTLTLSDYRLLYYGFVFQPEYLWNADQRRKEMNRAIKADQYARVIQLADSVLRTNPVSLTAYYYRTYAMLNADENDSACQKYIKRYTGLRNAILSSGDGQHCNTAFKTIYLEDEDEIMFHHFEMDRPRDQFLQYSCDRFLVTPSGTYLNTEIFFDISESLLALKKQRTSGRTK